jgi:hypothetical protein
MPSSGRAPGAATLHLLAGTKGRRRRRKHSFRSHVRVCKASAPPDAPTWGGARPGIASDRGRELYWCQWCTRPPHCFNKCSPHSPGVLLNGLACAYRRVRANAVSLHNKRSQLLARPRQPTPNAACLRRRQPAPRRSCWLRRRDIVTVHGDSDGSGVYDEDGAASAMAAAEKAVGGSTSAGAREAA